MSNLLTEVQWLILIALVSQVIFFILNNHWLHIQRTGVLFISYFLQFCAGAYVGMHYEHAVGKLIKKKWAITALFNIIEFISFGVEAGLPPYFCFW